jgi:hypothetical protein
MLKYESDTTKKINNKRKCKALFIYLFIYMFHMSV